MSDKSQWTLAKIRESYRQILRAYEDSHQYDQTRVTSEDETVLLNRNEKGEDEFRVAFNRKMREIAPKLKEKADASGNSVVWRRGDPLDSLSPAMKERVERALKFGV